MIKLRNLASKISDGLNTTAIKLGYNNFIFRIILDTDNYKKPTREANQVTYYIHGILSQINSDISNPSGNKFNGLLDTKLDLLVPIINYDKTLLVDNVEVESNVLELSGAIRDILDTYFSNNASGSMTDDDGVSYTYGQKYTLVTTGQRQLSARIGDCFSFSSYINYFFIQYGVNSKSVKVYIDGEEVDYTRLGILRQTLQESNVPSDITTGEAQNIPVSHTFTINFDMPTLEDTYIDNNYDVKLTAQGIYSEYLYGGVNKAHLVKIIRIQSNITYEHNYIMVFDKSADNFETVLNGATTVSMSVADLSNDAIELSNEASAYLQSQEVSNE